MKIPKLPKPVKAFAAFIIIFALGTGFGYKYVTGFQPVQPVKAEKNTTQAFVSEIYDKIKENYWDNISDATLLDLFKSSIERNGGGVTTTKFENKAKLLEAVSKTTQNLPEDQKNRFLSTVAAQVLTSLSPAGRSGLYTQRQEEQLKNTVSNINPEKDLYKDLGLAKGASEQAVSKAYQKQAEPLKNDQSPQAQEKLRQLTYANDVLTSKDQKLNYDKAGIEPTIFTKIASPRVLYVQYKKFSPTSLDEFQKAFDSYKDTQGINSLIFDLRGNVGGAIDATAYFLGFFLGKGQYAFDFYHKGEYLPFKTPTDKLASLTRYKQVVILVDQNTQSSAEMMAASFKKYRVGVVLGTPTKGWGTVERVFPLDSQISPKEKYSIFLVHSITLREDNQPIEGRGVDPDISIKDPAWQQKLLQYFNNPELTTSIESAYNP